MYIAANKINLSHRLSYFIFVQGLPYGNYVILSHTIVLSLHMNKTLQSREIDFYFFNLAELATKF